MANITFHEQPAHTAGELPKVGVAAPEFSAVKNDLAEVKLSDFRGKKVILNIFPSVDAPHSPAITFYTQGFIYFISTNSELFLTSFEQISGKRDWIFN